MYEARLNQFDFRLTKGLRFGGTRVRGMFDVYSLFNNATILSVNTRYGSNWLQPGTVQGPRTFKVGAEVNF